MPVAGSTYSDALSSERRLEILEQSVKLLARQTQALSPDRLADIPGLGDRPIYAVDGPVKPPYQESRLYRYAAKLNTPKIKIIPLRAHSRARQLEEYLYEQNTGGTIRFTVPQTS